MEAQLPTLRADFGAKFVLERLHALSPPFVADALKSWPELAVGGGQHSTAVRWGKLWVHHAAAMCAKLEAEVEAAGPAGRTAVWQNWLTHGAVPKEGVGSTLPLLLAMPPMVRAPVRTPGVLPEPRWCADVTYVSWGLSKLSPRKPADKLAMISRVLARPVPRRNSPLRHGPLSPSRTPCLP